MATTNFYLDKAGKEGKCFIMMTYLAGGQKFRYSVKYKINPAKWLGTKQRLKETTADDTFINAHLDSLRHVITDAQSQSLLNNREISFSFVKQKFLDVLGKKDTKRTLLQCFEEYIAYSKTIKKSATTERYTYTLKQLSEFRKSKRYELTFERINQNFYESFTNYLMTDKGLLNNSITTYIKTVKSFISFSLARGYCKPIHDLKNFKVFKEEAALIYLTEEELLKVYHLPLESTELNVVRENFCFACFTGLRYSDISRLQPENIKRDYIELMTEKTREFLKIPLNIYAKEIIRRNRGRLPKLYANNVTNLILKDLGKEAKLDDTIKVVKYRGAEKVEFVEAKYKFIGTHTARRTFVTLSLEKGMRPETVMSITGHKDYNTFKKYIKLTDKVKMIEMNNIWSAALHIA